MKYDQKGVSISEVLLIVLLISIISIIAIPRFNNVVRDAKWEACRTNVANINALVQLYYIKEGTWPKIDLSDIKTNINYFPEQTLPDCPVTPGAAYYIVPTGHRVTGHLRGVTPHP
jgi:general secretion pathway protein G